MSRPFNDITGKTFNKLTAIELVESRMVVYPKSGKKQWHYYWNCKCTCGNERIVNSLYLRKNQVKCCKTCVPKPNRTIFEGVPSVQA